MTQPTPAPTPAKDAKSRALRTFVQGLAVDVATTVVLVGATSLGDLHWTKVYWLAEAALLGKTAITAGISYVMRFVKPPATA